MGKQIFLPFFSLFHFIRALEFLVMFDSGLMFLWMGNFETFLIFPMLSFGTTSCDGWRLPNDKFKEKWSYNVPYHVSKIALRTFLLVMKCLHFCKQ